LPLRQNQTQTAAVWAVGSGCIPAGLWARPMVPTRDDSPTNSCRWPGYCTVALPAEKNRGLKWSHPGLGHFPLEISPGGIGLGRLFWRSNRLVAFEAGLFLAAVPPVHLVVVVLPSPRHHSANLRLHSHSVYSQTQKRTLFMFSCDYTIRLYFFLIYSNIS
jgi:hypothetical protein